MAGLTGALLVLPQGIAYAAIAGLPPEYGLYCAIGPAVIGALFGSSWHLVTGPTAPISIVVFSTLAPLAKPGSPEYIALALTLGFLTGAIQLAIGISRLGRLAHYISHSVIVGFASGAAFLIAASQLKHFFGLTGTQATGFFGQLAEAARLLPQADWHIAAAGAMALAAAIVSRRIHRALPHMIIGMIASAALATWFGGIPTVGDLPAALPRLSLPALDPATWAPLLTGAGVIAVLGLTEAIAIARAIALRSGQKIDSNQEVIGQGLANLTGSFLSGYPSSGSFTRSGLNYDAGAKTPLSAVFASLFLMLLIALIARWITYLPLAAMAGVLFLVAWGLIDRKEIAAILRGPKHERAVLLVTFSATLVVQLEYAIFIGIALSLALRRFGFAAEDEHGHGAD
ncbi:MAG: SulP family inorganic anion transporter [Burkholderiales bacterium]|nr:SulP family inorganic anion transporter [Burkholderiales bacterium]